MYSVQRTANWIVIDACTGKAASLCLIFICASRPGGSNNRSHVARIFPYPTIRQIESTVNITPRETNKSCRLLTCLPGPGIQFISRVTYLRVVATSPRSTARRNVFSSKVSCPISLWGNMSSASSVPAMLSVFRS